MIEKKSIDFKKLSDALPNFFCTKPKMCAQIIGICAKSIVFLLISDKKSVLLHPVLLNQ